MKLIAQAVLTALVTSPVYAATTWQPASNAVASASWDTFSFSSPTAGDSGSHGAAQASTGTLIITSDLSTMITDSYDAPPGGFLGNPDTYYIHNGGFTWTADVSLNQAAGYARVSYALFAGGMGGPAAFGVAPAIAGATEINAGSYAAGNNTVFFVDLELPANITSVSASFGDLVFPNFPGSFRSIDSVQVELFDAVPVPEPSLGFLFLVGSLAGFARRRRCWVFGKLTHLGKLEVCSCPTDNNALPM